ncbi:hypothetical protein PG993_008877 [Apiospora rasikravindrae]|uniref:Uncharacterized protein n=1 Tax=Apiospora rasikravindrae TaxID=990691 RepID=A0ABR1SPL4_9PEZI
MSLVPASETAAQKALRIPEIVAMIAEELHDGALPRHREPRLENFIHVNRLWFNSGVHLLWRRQLYWDWLNLVDIFLKIHPSRRPFYAAFIEYASINIEQTADAVPMQLFHHIDFPMLKELHINIMNPHCTQLPLLGKHNIRTVRILSGAVFNCKARMIREVIEQCLVSTYPSFVAAGAPLTASTFVYELR